VRQHEEDYRISKITGGRIDHNSGREKFASRQADGVFGEGFWGGGGGFWGEPWLKRAPGRGRGDRERRAKRRDCDNVREAKDPGVANGGGE